MPTNGHPADGAHDGEVRSAGVATLTGYGISSRWVLVTPEAAAAWLEKNVKNRKAAPGLVKRYATDMMAGDWLITHQGVAFASDGSLVDGQHRLKAVVESGEAQWMLVTTGLPLDAVEALDRGKIRSLSHTLQIMGFDLYSNKVVAIARAMRLGPLPRNPQRQPTDVEIRRFMERHHEALVFASSQPLGMGPAACYAVLGRAYYHAAPERLARFVRAALDRLEDDDRWPGDRSARSLATAVRLRKHTSGADAAALYRKAQNALRAYLDGRAMDKLYENAADLFPLKDEPR